MDISGVAIPAVPEAQAEPPRDAQSQAAVRETSESEFQQSSSDSNTRSERQPDPDSSLGQNVDEHA